MKSQYTVEITQANNGYMVRAGCLIMVYVDHNELLKDLGAWLRDSETVEAQYISRHCVGQGPAREDRVELRDEAGSIRSGYESEGLRRTSVHPQDIPKEIERTRR